MRPTVNAAMIDAVTKGAEALPIQPVFPSMTDEQWAAAVSEAGVQIAEADTGLVFILAAAAEAAGNIRPFECIREAVRKLSGLTRLERDLLSEVPEPADLRYFFA